MDANGSRSGPVNTQQRVPGSSRESTDPVRLAQYRILKRLGQGGMGVVLLAEDEALGRQAALKVMRPEYAAQEQARARFLREARATAALKHDNVVTIYQVGEDRGIPFLAMEVLTGKSLDDWLRPDRRASLSETLAIAKQIARGLAAAHAAGLVHRDIKPANIWLEAPTGRVKLLDFGLARHVAGEFSQLTQTGAILGTPAFMAPEQVQGQVADHRCDLFSFGCVLYRMVTGRVPFQGNTLIAVYHAVASEVPPIASSLNPSVPPRLAALIAALLEKRPEDRPESAEAVLAELSAIEKDLKATSAVNPAGKRLPTTVDHVPPPAQSYPPRRRAWIIGAVALALICILAMVIAFRTPRSELEQPPGSGAGATAPAKGLEGNEAPKPAPEAKSDPAPSVVGDWDFTFQNGKSFKFTFSPDRTMSGENGYNGHWSQDGLKVSFRGIGQKPGEKLSFWKGEIDSTGRTMNFTADGGVACVCVRRPAPTQSVIGQWQFTFKGGRDGPLIANFTFSKDGTMYSSHGYKGRWTQDGRTLKFEGGGVVPGGFTRWEGEIDPTSQTMQCRQLDGPGAANCLRLP